MPAALVDATFEFEATGSRLHWLRRNIASPGSIGEISFRIINLQAAWRDRNIDETKALRTKAMEINEDLIDWERGVSTSWRYQVVEATDDLNDTKCFRKQRHIYPSLWIAKTWNSWRILRFLVGQMLRRAQGDLGTLEGQQSDATNHQVREMSTDICISLSAFGKTSGESAPDALAQS